MLKLNTFFLDFSDESFEKKWNLMDKWKDEILTETCVHNNCTDRQYSTQRRSRLYQSI